MYQRDRINLSLTNRTISNLLTAGRLLVQRRHLGWLLHIDPENNAIQDKTATPTVLFTRSHLHCCSQHLRLSNTIANWPNTTLANMPKSTPLMITLRLFPFSR